MCEMMKMKDPSAMITAPVAIHTIFVWRAPMKLMNIITTRAPGTMRRNPNFKHS
ncbi:hypothetical protein DPMN_096986 [Dreissena polymorpha]|uniref:Uncharacterized protein n=1 Tax=Dreissena polymorpha TaxID=45954 RepID=A0A9D4R4B1_DREPO|nr:hypothetical protein DPMN_096986 [Dreissena polymorpha]